MRKLILSIAFIVSTGCQKMESVKTPLILPITEAGQNNEPSEGDDQTIAEPVPDNPEEKPPVEPPVVIKKFSFPSCQELNTLWKIRYHATLKVNWPVKDIECSGPSKDRAFAEAAYILEKTIFNLKNLPSGVQAPPKDMLGFVTTKYRELRIGPNDYPSTDVDNKIVYFYPQVENESGFSVVGNLIHEARHADSNFYLHMPCWDGPNQGQQMCDFGLGDSFYEGGPHRIAILYFAWGAARANWPEEWKTTARDLAEYVVNNRINATASARKAWINKYLKDW